MRTLLMHTCAQAVKEYVQAIQAISSCVYGGNRFILTVGQPPPTGLLTASRARKLQQTCGVPRRETSKLATVGPEQS